MMAPTLNHESLWQAFIQDPAFEGMPLVFHDIIREYVGYMEAALKNFLSLPVQLRTLAAAKQAFLEFRIKREYYHRVCAIMEGVQESEKETILERNLTQAYLMLNWLGLISREPQRYQLAYGQDIMRVLQRLGAKPEVLEAVQSNYSTATDASSFTIADLIAIQPRLVFTEDF